MKKSTSNKTKQSSINKKIKSLEDYRDDLFCKADMLLMEAEDINIELKNLKKSK